MSSISEILPKLQERMHASATIAGSHPAGIIAINKSASFLTHPNPRLPRPEAGVGAKKLPPVRRVRTAPCWLDAPYSMEDECFDLGGQPLYLCNRLDSATSGIFITCTNAALAAEIKERWAHHSVTKIYLAVLRGKVGRTFEKWVDSLREEKRAGERGVRVSGKKGPSIGRKVQLAKTNVRRLQYTQYDPRMSLVAMQPFTGRTHQLRIQSQIHNVPIVGDNKYGDFRLNRLIGDKHKEIKGRLFLHSFCTRFEFTVGPDTHSFSAEAPVPKSFWAVLGHDHTSSVETGVSAMLKG